MFHSAVACQGYQIYYYFLNIQKVTVVREISSIKDVKELLSNILGSMNKKSYFNSNNSIFLRFSNSFNIQWFRVVQKISLMKKSCTSSSLWYSFRCFTRTVTRINSRALHHVLVDFMIGNKSVYNFLETLKSKNKL